MASGKKTGGRVKGTPNKSTAAVKEALGQAFSSIGGVKALSAWARGNPGEFYKLWAKLLPQEVNAQLSGAVTVTRVELVGPENGVELTGPEDA